MPYEIVLNASPAGYSLSAGHAGEKVAVLARGFTSSEDGDEFIQRLEGFPNQVISLLPQSSSIKPSQIDHLLVMIRRDKTAIVFVNELHMIGKMRLLKSKEVGEPIFQDDIADIETIEFEGLDIPRDVGVVFVFSAGWRKALFFDFTPLIDPFANREYDLSQSIGHYFNYLQFQDFFKITDDEWLKLFRQQWFPFVTLKRHTVYKMLSHLRAGWVIDKEIDSVASEVRGNLESISERWCAAPLFQEHVLLLKRAIERYAEEDFISATSILYSRIEGIIRSLRVDSSNKNRITQNDLADTVLSMRNDTVDGYSLLLPRKFHDYLTQVYFAGFEPGQAAPVSRNTVGHGVALQGDFSKKAATIGLLIVDQIYFHIPPSST